jgi:hypothetical protein
MAIIRKRLGPGSHRVWYVQIRKRRYLHQTRTFDTKAESLAWATAIGSEMVRGVFISRAEAEDTTLGEVLRAVRRRSDARQEGRYARGQPHRLLLCDPISSSTLMSI